MQSKLFSIYCNSDDIRKNLEGLELEFLDDVKKAKSQAFAVVVKYLEGEKQDSSSDVEPVIAAFAGSDIPVIVLDRTLMPEHSQRVWRRKNVVRYLPLDEPAAAWEEVRHYLSHRMKHQRRILEITAEERVPVGRYVKISPEDFKKHNLVSLFLGSMGDFLVNLKLMLDAVRPEKLPVNPVTGMDMSRMLEFEWAVRNNKVQHDFEGSPFKKSGMITYLEKNRRKALFQTEPQQSFRNHIIIEGESGTGKSIIAEFIHNYVYDEFGPKQKGDLKKINCANLGEKIMETQLFGSIKGAYTDAVTRAGLILEAYNGTLFLDEIGEVPPQMQARLLAYIETQKIEPTGWSGEGIYVPSLIVAATNRSLKDEVDAGRFRRDLHHRLGFTVTIPPLRKRVGDMDRLMDFVLQNPNFNPVKTTGKEPERAVDWIEKSALALLKQQRFPGNFRELEQLMRRAVILARSRGIKTITEENLKECLGN